MSVTWRTASLDAIAPVAAPGGADVRALPGFGAGRLAHVTCAAGRGCAPPVLRGVARIVHVLDGSGELRLPRRDATELVALRAGRSVVIPPGVATRYRAGADGVRLLVATMPGGVRAPWAGPWTVEDVPAEPLTVAPDGSDVRPLARVADDRGSLAHFSLPPGRVSRAVRHHEIEEIWFFVAGAGELWRDGGDPVAVGPGVALTIPARVAFQFRSTGEEPLGSIGLTLPAWPLDRSLDEVIDTDVRGVWPA